MMNTIIQLNKIIFQWFIELSPKWITGLLPHFCIKWPLFGKPFYHMEILKVEENLFGNLIVIETTGAQYELTRAGMTLVRRIDPKTNSVNPRLVGKLSFKNDIGFLRVKSVDKRTCIVESNLVTFEFNSDSLFFISSKTPTPMTYEYTNFIENTVWNKSGLKRKDIENSEKLSRMWTDGYGGSLHCYVEGPIAITRYTENSSLFTLDFLSKMAHMVFPPRFFDFEALYGKNAKPHVWFATSKNQLDILLELVDDPGSTLNQGAFGYIVFWHKLYTNPAYPKKTYKPITIDHPSAKVGYEFDEPDYVKKSINKLHARGFKVLVYMKSYFFAITNPSMEATLRWMKDFQNEYGYDGYFFDSAEYGKVREDNWYNTYQFIRRVREQLGDKGYIYHHNSVDVWGGYTGLRAIMVDTYCNAQLAGETTYVNLPVSDNACVNYPDENYMRFFTSGYGLSQAIGTHKRLDEGRTENEGEPIKMKLALSHEEKQRLVGQNLNGMERFSSEVHYKKSQIYIEAYNKRKATYLAGHFDPDVQWPPHWFKRITNVKVKKEVEGSNNKFTITWDTEEPTDSTVTYTSDKIWWKGKFPCKELAGVTNIYHSESTSYRIVLSLPAQNQYQIRIRSSNKKEGLYEKIWGYVGNLEE